MTGVPNKRTIYFFTPVNSFSRKIFRFLKWIIFSIDFLINWKSWVCTFIRYFYSIKFGFFKKIHLRSFTAVLCSHFSIQFEIGKFKVSHFQYLIFERLWKVFERDVIMERCISLKAFAALVWVATARFPLMCFAPSSSHSTSTFKVDLIVSED